MKLLVNVDISLLKELCQILGVSINELLLDEKIDNDETKSKEIILDSLVEYEKQRKRISQGSMLLRTAVVFNISIIIFGIYNLMVITFGGHYFWFYNCRYDYFIN